MSVEHKDNLRFDDLIVENDNIRYWRKRFEDRKGLIGSPIIAQVLYEYYKEDRDKFFKVNYDGNTRAFPIMTIDDWSENCINPDELITGIDDSDWKTLYDKQFIWDMCMQQASLSLDEDTEWKRIQVRDYVWNNPLYRIKDITNSGDGFRFKLGMTDYYSYVSHSTRIVEEVYDHCQRFNINSDSDPDEAKDLLIDRLDFRDEIAPSFNSMVGDNHQNTLGTITTTLLNTSDGLKVVIVDRSPLNVDYPDAIGIAPSGVYAPTFNIEEEADMTYNMLREFGEEVLANEEFRHPPEDIESKDWIDEYEDVSELSDMIEGTGAHFNITGLAFNALSSAPQVYGLLYIEDEEYSDFVDERVENEDTRGGNSRTEPVKDALDSVMSDKWAPGAAVALSQSLRVAEREHNLDIF